MDKMSIEGGTPLKGEVEVSGAKNAALPILISTLLTDERCTYRRVPELMDIDSTLKLLSHLGIQFNRDFGERRVEIEQGSARLQEAPYDLVRKMRASVLVLGPLLARYGEAKVSLPGGCAIGARPIDIHLRGFEALGAEIGLDQGYIEAKTRGLKGAKIPLSFPSVGATENLMMAAALAEGETRIENAAREPEIVDLANTLRSMGAKVKGDGSSEILIEGVKKLNGCDFTVIGDRIEAGTFLCAGFISGIFGKSDVRVKGISPETIESLLLKLEESGSKVIRESDSIQIISEGRPKAVDVETEPYPGFPTDMQAQLMAALSIADGDSIITENIFEQRFMHVSEYLRLGADIWIQGKKAMVRGVENLKGAPLMATDLRASAGLIIVGLAAEGRTIINRIYHLDRGYENVEEKLSAIGAKIKRIKT